MTRLEEAGRCLEPDVQPSIYKQLIELDDSKAIQSLTAWKWLEIIISIHFKQVGFGSFRWALVFLSLIDESRYPWNSIHCESNQEKMMCFQELGLSGFQGKTSPPDFFRCESFHFQGCIHALFPASPHISFTTEKPHERGGISHWLDNRPHSAAVSLQVDDGNLACLMLLGVSVCKLDFTYYLNNY